MTRPILSVILVNWNTRELLLRALASCRDTLAGIASECIVVDNGSTDGSPDAVAAEFPGARLLRMIRNRGFGSAVNAAAEASRGEFLLVLNSDARLEPGAAAALVDALRRVPRAGMAGALLRNEDGTPQRSCAAEPRLWSEILGHGAATRLAPGAWGPAAERPGAETVPVETLVGACFAIRRDCLREIGPLDERFFLFLEETDWCVRARRAGWKVLLVPAARAVHAQGASRRGAADVRAKVEYARSLLRYFRKHGGRASAAVLGIALLLRNLAGLVLNGAVCLATLGLADGPRRRTVRAAALTGWLLAGGRPVWGLQPPDVRWERYQCARNHSAGVTWWTDLDADPEPLPVPPERWIRTDAWTRLKDLPGKAVYRTGGDDPPSLIKIYKPLRRRTGWRSLFRPSRAVRELLAARELQGRGVPGVRPVRAGELRVQGFLRESCVIFPWLAGARGIDVILAGWRDLSVGDRSAWAAALGAFCRRIHDAGVDPYDFEPNNVLAVPSDPPSLRLIDYEKIRFRAGPLSRADRIRSLAKWIRWPGPGRTDRLRTLAAYLSGREGREGLRAWVRDLDRAAQALRDRDAAAAARRCLEDNRNYGVCRRDGWMLVYRRERPDAGQRGLPAAGIAGVLAEARVVEGERIRDGLRMVRMPDARRAWIRSQSDRRLSAWRERIDEVDRTGPVAALLRDGGGDGVLIHPAGPEAA